MKVLLLLLSILFSTAICAQDGILTYEDVEKNGKTAKAAYDINTHDYSPYTILHLIKDNGGEKRSLENVFYVKSNNKYQQILLINTEKSNLTCMLSNSILYIIKKESDSDNVVIINKETKLDVIDKIHRKLAQVP